mmetsp:Transcript_6989/g.20540  ORF Transcript_6989/g.20540 Transcript_6989/m.20540 type:complete len:332 (+) Transcript_6989:2047-3042(+)
MSGRLLGFIGFHWRVLEWHNTNWNALLLLWSLLLLLWQCNCQYTTIKQLGIQFFQFQSRFTQTESLLEFGMIDSVVTMAFDGEDHIVVILCCSSGVVALRIIIFNIDFNVTRFVSWHIQCNFEVLIIAVINVGSRVLHLFDWFLLLWLRGDTICRLLLFHRGVVVRRNGSLLVGERSCAERIRTAIVSESIAHAVWTFVMTVVYFFVFVIHVIAIAIADHEWMDGRVLVLRSERVCSSEVVLGGRRLRHGSGSSCCVHVRTCAGGRTHERRMHWCRVVERMALLLRDIVHHGFWMRIGCCSLFVRLFVCWLVGWLICVCVCLRLLFVEFGN